MEIPLLQALKPYKLYFNGDQFISLDPNSAFGNLNLSWMEIVIRIECVNDLITTLFTDFDNLQNQLKQTHTGTLDQGYRQKFYTEQVFYWLRKTADELISLISLLENYKNEGTYPKKIKISSIGDFLKSKIAFNGNLDGFKKILEILNEVSNGFKHSFINSQIHAYQGSEYPVVFAYTLHFNDRSKQPKFHTLDLREVLKDYDLFLSHVKQYVKSNFELSK